MNISSFLARIIITAAPAENSCAAVKEYMFMILGQYMKSFCMVLFCVNLNKFLLGYLLFVIHMR